MGLPRKVLFVAWAPFFSGAERALLLTLQSLDRNRYIPYVLSGSEGEFSKQVRQLDIPCDVATLAPLESRRPAAGLASIGAVVRAAMRCRASLIHANEAPRFQPAGYAARLLGVPAVTHVRFPDSASGFRWFLKPRFARALFVSNALRAAAIAEAPGLFDDCSEVLHDGVEMQPPWSDADVRRVRAELGLPLDRTLVALTGQISEVKGIWDFAAAAGRVATGSPAVHFAVLGDDLKGGGALRRAMEERIASLGLAERFTFLGYRSDAPRIVQAFDIIAVPSHVEPLGNATLEAMAAGRPVIGSRVGGIPEMIVEGETGLLIPPQDPAALADAMDGLASDAGRRTAMSKAARLRAREMFSIESHGRRVQACYDAVCTSSRRHRQTEEQVA